MDGKLFEVIKDVECMDGVLFVNVMFFKLYWDEKFYYKMVDNCGFMVICFYIVGVMMMYWIGLYNYYDDEKEKLQMVEMFLVYKFFSFIIFMFYYVELFECLEKLLIKEQLKVWMGKMQKKVVVIFLFKGVVEVIYDLQKYLVGLGLIEVIDKNKVDLLCMFGKKDLYLVSVFYVIVFEWDIEGNFFD